jgi:hypothetical protein
MKISTHTHRNGVVTYEKIEEKYKKKNWIPKDQWDKVISDKEAHFLGEGVVGEGLISFSVWNCQFP